jgi:hypothetical protein
VLSAHRGKSQGRPATTSSSQLISQNGLPVRVSQRPHVPGTQGCRQGRTAVSSPDNAKCYATSFDFRATLTELEARHILIPPYTPRWNGKIERFFRTLDTEWARSRVWAHSTQRDRALSSFIRYYNRRRPHSACSGRPPITRVQHLRGQDS